MGEPKFTDNVRRIDFAKAAKPRARAEDSPNKTESVRSSRERL